MMLQAKKEEELKKSGKKLNSSMCDPESDARGFEGDNN